MFKRSLMAGAVAFAFAGPAAAQYSGTAFFGDSLSDAGTFAAIGAVPSVVGKFTTNPGPVWTEILATKYGGSAAPAVAGGDIYAVGGARVTSLPGYPDAAPTNQATPVTDQITAYLASHGGRANSNALHSVWAGANDIFVIAPTPANAQAYLFQTTGELVAQIARLQAAGARYIIVPTIPDIGITPAGLSQGAAGAAGLTQLSQGFNQLLFGGIGLANLNVVPIDTFTLLREIVASPAAYGFTGAAATTVPACGSTPSLICSSASLRPGATPFNTVFADGVHPTTGAHRIIADFVAAQLAAPGQISLLPESMIKTRMGLNETIHNQIAMSRAGAANATRVWATLGGGRLEFERNAAFPQADGHPYGLTVGVDRRISPNLMVGAAGTAGRFDADFAGGGGYSQDDLAMSFYAAWASGPISVTAIGSLGQSDFDIDRVVRLGPAVRKIGGDTDGEQASLAVRGAFELGGGALNHGPFAGVTLQRLDVNGFSEKNGGSAALGFGNQKRNSIIGELGYQASYDLKTFMPFGRIGVEREFRDSDRNVNAFLLSMSAPAFQMPAAKLDRTWGTATVGAALRLGGNLTGSVALTSQFGQSDVRNYAVQVGLAIGL